MTNTKRIIFGLGSNLGDRELNLETAVKELEKSFSLSNLSQSKIFKNPALLLPNSPVEWNIEFFNIALSANVDIDKYSPQQILKEIKKIEKILGRQEREKWAPREIDIDILIIEDVEVKEDNLIIPHQHLFERDFFIKTIEEIEKDLLESLQLQR